MTAMASVTSNEMVLMVMRLSCRLPPRATRRYCAPLDPILRYMVYTALQHREGRSMALTIGQVATAADVNIQTIRYYERRGLFPTPRRTPAGYRQYADDAIARLRFIKHAQDLGFSLNDIQELLGLRVRHGAACDAVERKTRKKIEVVQQ